jgi:hypothetical protein
LLEITNALGERVCVLDLNDRRSAVPITLNDPLAAGVYSIRLWVNDRAFVMPLVVR